MVVVIAILGLLPASKTKNRLLSLIGRNWDIGPRAILRPCLLWRIKEFQIGDLSYIGTGTVFRDLTRVSMGPGCEIGQWNWITGLAQFVHQEDGSLAGTLELADRVGITSRHYFDCSGGIRIGRLSTIGGLRSMILTRGVDVRRSMQAATPVHIGENSLITAGVIITPGTTITDRCVVAAGSVVARDLLDPETLYAGSPARPVRKLDGAPYFDRTELRMMPRHVAESRARHNRQGTS